MIKASKSKFFQPLWLLLSLLLLCCLIACGGSTDTADTGGDTPTVTAASLDLIASPPTVKSDGTTSSTITVTAKNSSNATLSGVVITMSTDTGNLATGTSGTVTTGTDGTATATFSSGGGVNGPINRTATITATAGSVSSQIPIEVVGSTVILTSTGTSLNNAGTNSITLTVTATNAGGAGVNGAAVTLTQSSDDGGSVNFGSSSGTTATVNSVMGVFKTTVTGATAGTVSIIARALGASATATVTVATVAEAFAIDQQTLCNPGCAIVAGNPDPTAMKIGDQLQIRVNVPAAYAGSDVVFASLAGTWTGGDSTRIVTPVGGKATATLNTASATVDTVHVYLQGYPAIQDTLTVAMSSGAAAHSIILQATPTVVPRKTASTTGTSTITATVRDAGGFIVAGAPVAFSIVNPTGGGETIDPVVKITLADGKASTTFTSGTLPSSDAEGVKIHAKVVGTSVQTGVAPSGNDAAITIGGVAGSLAFGLATELEEIGGDPPTQYRQSMSVLVTDISGNPVQGAVVSLSLWPIAWSTGKDFACSFDSEYVWDYTDPLDPVLTDTIDGSKGTFLNEDVNENLILDNYGSGNFSPPAVPDPPPYDISYNEDGLRIFYYPIPTAHDSDGIADGTPTRDFAITPPNAAASVSPNTATTGTNGIATFDVIYPKDSAIWTVVRVKATTIVQGSEAVGQKIFRLSALASDVSPCRLECPYKF